jgi:hypothetical protein
MDYCTTYGFPESIRSDRGPQFVSDVWQVLCNKLGIRNCYTVPYRPCGNVTEVCNKFIKQLIKSYCDDKHKNWDANLNAIAFAIRTAPNESTGYSPAALTFGRELRTPFDVIKPPNNNNKKDTDEYVNDLVNRLSIVYKETTKKCLKAREKHIKQYNKHRQPNPFKVNDLVLRTTHTLSSAIKEKASQAR